MTQSSMTAKLRTIGSGERAKSTATLVLAQVVNLASILAIAHLYPQAAFGGYSMVFAAATIVAGVSALRLDLAVTIADEPDTFALRRSAIRANVAIGSAAGVAAMLWRVEPGQAFGLAAVAITLGVSTTQTYACVRRRRYLLIAASKLVAAAVTVAVQLVAATADPSASTLLLASATGYGASIVMLRKASTCPPSDARTMNVLRRHRPFVLASAPACIVNAITVNVPLFVAAAAVGSVATANLALAMRVGALPAALFGQALMPILFGEIAHRLRTAPATALRSYHRVLGGLFAVGLISQSALAVGVYYLAPAILGNQWTAVGVLLVVLTPSMIASFAVSPVSQTLNATGHNRTQLVWDVGRLIAISAAFVPMLAGWASFTGGVVLFSATMTVAYAVHAGLARAGLKAASEKHAYDGIRLSAVAWSTKSRAVSDLPNRDAATNAAR